MSFICNYGIRAVMKTSWTELNPGRRFWGCPQYMGNGRRGCNFLQWDDPVPCTRCVNVIPGLLRRIDRLENENERKAKNERNLMIAVVICVIWIAILLSYTGSEEKNEGRMKLYQLE